MKLSASFSLFLAAATAQTVIESSSFGHGERISPNRDSIPGWQIGGEGHVPQILSDKIILTPPYPGLTRGYAWAEKPISESEWTAEFQFRASGQERGGGNLQLWYTKDGRTKIGTSSIYTVGQFDGFALAVDSHGGRGGSIRGFLNDGTTDYKRHRSVDTLAFGHCEYHYRNLGRPSIVRLKQTNSVFEVTVDGKLCFSTNKVSLPAGNNFGVTAATPENPDSFEVFQFVVQSAPSGTAQKSPTPEQEQLQVVERDQSKDSQSQSQDTTDKNFVELGHRLQLINHATNNIIREIGNEGAKSENRHSDLIREVASLDSRLQRMEQSLQNIQRDLEGKDYGHRFAQLHDTLKSSHLSLSESLQGHLFDAITKSAPRTTFFVFIVLASQVLLVASFIIYKRRRANAPKKFL